MLRRIPPPVFWIALLAVVFGLGYRVFAEMQPDDGGFSSSASATAPRREGAARSAAPATSAPAVAARASETVALAPGTRAMPGGRWAPDGDFTYRGHWEHITRNFDGRTNGSSSRSYRPGSQAVLTFDGRSVRLFGVVGPGGGLGTVEIDGRLKRTIDFYGATKAVHKLVFDSGPLGPGTHRLTLSVVPDQALPVARSHYVNIDGAEIGP